MAPKGLGHLVGRDAELAAIGASAGHAALVVVRGPAGTGKTALLTEIRRTWRDRGCAVVSIACSKIPPQWDLFGAHTVLDAFRNSFHKIGDADLTRNLGALRRLCVPETYQSAHTRGELFSGLVRLFTWLRAGAHGAVLIDDIHSAPNPGLAVSAASRAGCTVVVAGREQGATGISLGPLADRVVDLRPLAAQHIDELLAGASPEPLDDAVAPAVRAALGSLSGNPGAALDTFRTLRHENGLILFDGHLCLRDPAVEPALPAEHDLVRQVTRHGELGRQLVAVTAAAAGFHMDDLLVFAAAAGHEPAACGRTVDELVAAGALECDAQERLQVPCPALVPALWRGFDRDELADVHRAIAEHVLRDRAATRMLRLQPTTAAHWYRTALRHSETGEARARVLASLLRLLVQLADYETLADVVAERVRVGVADRQRAELAAAAALAAVHTGRPVSEQVARALDGRPLEFAARWFAGSACLADVSAAFAPLAGDESGKADGPGDQFDPVLAFRQVLGSAYGEPRTGPLAAYDRILRGYLSGDWAGIPAAVRALELSSPPHTPVLHAGRLLAAEVYGALGDLERGAEWLARAGNRSPFPALHSWVAMGIASRASAWERARQLGWAAHEQIAETGWVGISWLLSRQVLVEWRSGDHKNLPHLHAEVKRWHARLGGEGLRGVELTAQAGAEHDYAIAWQAVEILRVHGNRGELMLACMIAAFLADDPRPWYHEAYRVAKHVGSKAQGALIAASMRDSGIAPPRDSGTGSALSGLELRIVDLVCKGLTNRQIAGKLRVSEKTVENNLTRLFAKTGSRSRVDLTLASMQGRLRPGGAP